MKTFQGNEQCRNDNGNAAISELFMAILLFPNGYVIVRTQSIEMTLRSSECTALCQPFARTDSFLIHSSHAGAISYLELITSSRAHTCNISP